MLLDPFVLATGALIFLTRVVDVSLGTMRMISTVQGRPQLAFLLGFTEVSIWLFVITAVIKNISDNPILGTFYALGFATGNVVRIIIERNLAFGHVNLRIITTTYGNMMASKIRDLGFAVTSFRGEGVSGPVTELYILCKRREVKKIVQCAQHVEQDVFFVTEPVGVMRKGDAQFSMHNHRWKPIFKKK